jgi:hypothetical protein
MTAIDIHEGSGTGSLVYEREHSPVEFERLFAWDWICVNGVVFHVKAVQTSENGLELMTEWGNSYVVVAPIHREHEHLVVLALMSLGKRLLNSFVDFWNYTLEVVCIVALDVYSRWA